MVERLLPQMEASQSSVRQPSAPHSLAIGAIGAKSSADITLRPSSAGCSPSSPTDWAHQLTAGDVLTRRTAALTFARSPQDAAHLGEALRTGLLDDDTKVRSTVASSLGRMGRMSSEFAPDLEDILRYDADAEVRAGAVRALGMLDLHAARERATCPRASSSVQKAPNAGPKRSASAGALTGGPGTSTSSRQQQSVGGASGLGNSAGATHMSLLVGALKDGDIKVRTAAEVALRNLHSATSVRRRSLSKTNKLEKSRTLQEADLRARGLTSDLGEDGGLYARLLANRLDDPDPKVRTWTAETLGVIGGPARPHARELIRMARDGKEDQRVQLAAEKASQLILRNSKAEAEPRGRSGARRGASRGKKTSSPKKGASPKKKTSKKK